MIVIRRLSFFTNGTYLLTAGTFHFSKNYLFFLKNIFSFKKKYNKLFLVLRVSTKDIRGDLTGHFLEKEKKSGKGMDILTSSSWEQELGSGCM